MINKILDYVAYFILIVFFVGAIVVGIVIPKIGYALLSVTLLYVLFWSCIRVGCKIG